jgi:hypothetical protein
MIGKARVPDGTKIQRFKVRANAIRVQAPRRGGLKSADSSDSATGCRRSDLPSRVGWASRPPTEAFCLGSKEC